MSRTLYPLKWCVGILGLMGWTELAFGGKETPKLGVVVEKVAIGTALDDAGVQPGDRFYSWYRDTDPPSSDISGKIPFTSVFSWMRFVYETAPLGSVTLTGERNGQPKDFQFPLAHWHGSSVRPAMDGPDLTRYQRGKQFIDEGSLTKGIAIWEALLQDWNGSQQGSDSQPIQRTLMGLWLQLQMGKAWSKARSFEAAHRCFETALDQLNKNKQDQAQGDFLWAQVALWEATASTRNRQGQLKKAFEASRKILVLLESHGEETMAVADFESYSGRLSRHHGNLQQDLTSQNKALRIRQSLAPNSLEVARSFINLGIIREIQGKFKQAQELYDKALPIVAAHAPLSSVHTSALINSGNNLQSQGDLDGAWDRFLKALEINKVRDPKGRGTAIAMLTLGNIAEEKGDIQTGESYYKQALEMVQQTDPGSLLEAGCLNNVALILIERGDLDGAEANLKRALDIYEKQGPTHHDVALFLGNLGQIAIFREDWPTAEAYFSRAQAIYKSISPDSPTLALMLNAMGRMARLQGHFTKAREHHNKALESQLRHAPDTIFVADSYYQLGRAFAAEKNWRQAAEYFQKSLAILKEQVPESREAAESAYQLALSFQNLRTPGEADRHFRQAMTTIESQIGKLGGPHALEAGYRSKFEPIYKDYMAFLIQEKRLGEAFEIGERSRAQMLLQAMSERDLFSQDDANPQDLERTRQRIAARYDQSQEILASLSPSIDKAQHQQYLEKLRGLRTEYDDILQQIQRRSPRMADLHRSKTLNLEQVKQMLDPGTTLLSYAVTETSTYLFVVKKTKPLKVHTIPMSRKALREQVSDLHAFIKNVDSSSAKGFLDQVCSKLYGSLIAPADLEASERLLIIPDGPLLTLPFHLLRDGTHPQPRLLLEWKPTTTIVSATVFWELKNRKQAPKGAYQLAAFGDPIYPKEEGWHQRGGPQLRSFGQRMAGKTLKRLPHSATEVTSIAELYGDRAKAYLREQATEARAKATSRHSQIVHFACHAGLDNRFPLNSALAFTIPQVFAKEQENGLLQAWEIMEQMTLNADLVVLSACDTGLGRVLKGEGLLGLTRAFQFAGARSILATLWAVDDGATADLMQLFYRHLKAGLTKDEALRQAQLTFLKKGGRPGKTSSSGENLRSHPYFWAAFHLIGPWD